MSKATEYLVTDQISTDTLEVMGYKVGNLLFVHKNMVKNNALFRTPTTDEYKMLSESTSFETIDGQKIHEIEEK